MHIQFVSKGIDVSPALRERIEARIEEGVAKYFNRPGEAYIVATREGSGFKVDCSLHLPSGAFLQAHDTANDAYAAAEGAVIHLEKRLRRYKRRLKDHHTETKAELPAEETPILILRDERESYAAYEDEASDHGANDTSGADEPVIVAEKVGELKTMTVGFAVLEMGLVDAPFLLFRNAAHGGLNVVYRRPDGHVGWIDPSRGAKDSAA